MSAAPPLADAICCIDWDRPWLELVRAFGQAAHLQVATGASVSTALSAVGGAHGDKADVMFVPASALPAATPYESFVGRTGRVPTRNNLHDLFNGLVWLAFPQTKRWLNRCQTAEIARAGGTSGRARGALRDALTVLDENGAFLQAPDVLWQALAARDWARLFIELRPLWQQARLVPFGHALLEKLVQPRKSITAHVLRLPTVIAPGTDALDTAMMASLSPQRLLSCPAFMPLPVLGIPGWWPENGAAEFYDDVCVFRPRRPPTAAH